MISCVYTYLKTYQILYFKYIQFIVCQLYLSKAIKKKEQILAPTLVQLILTTCEYTLSQTLVIEKKNLRLRGLVVAQWVSCRISNWIWDCQFHVERCVSFSPYSFIWEFENNSPWKKYIYTYHSPSIFQFVLPLQKERK